MLWAKRRISIRQLIVKTTDIKNMQNASDQVDDVTFKKAAGKLMKEKSALWRRLADK